MNLPMFQIDAFTRKVFSGNPAAVCPLKEWLDERIMQHIARENNLSETAFFVPEGEDFAIRWFTPLTEVDLCGHATLATAFVIFTEIDPSRTHVSFSSKSGPLAVKRSGDMLSMDFPSQPPEPCDPPEKLMEGLGIKPCEVLKSSDYFVVYDNEEDIRRLDPEMHLLKKIDLRGVIVTAPGRKSDFVSRFFAPQYGIDEDPVTGSAHCALIPYWSKRLNKKSMYALQLSSRGGEIHCTQESPRVIISGYAAKYLEGSICIDERLI
jgi:PhzF family phenazine biosynthesis protein